jgi:hypothetical protein
MSKGGYNGGSTIFGPGFYDWFGQAKGKPEKKNPVRNAFKLTSEEREAELQYLISLTAERLAKLQADFDAARLKDMTVGETESDTRTQRIDPTLAVRGWEEPR